jgi:hypothetical protein
MTQELRAAAREAIELKVLLADGSTALTRNIGADGIYLMLPPGSTTERWMSFEFDIPELGLKFTARGETVRTTMTPYGIGVALRFHDSQLVPLHSAPS